MKDLQTYNLVELDSQEMKETNGGFPVLAAFAIGFVIGVGVKLWDYYRDKE